MIAILGCLVGVKVGVKEETFLTVLDTDLVDEEETVKMDDGELEFVEVNEADEEAVSVNVCVFNIDKV